MTIYVDDMVGRQANEKNKTIIILVLGALSAISPFSIDMYLAAFPQIADSLNSTVAKVSLSLSAYFIGLAVGQLFYGPLLDHYGRKKPIYAGLSLFVLASLGCMVVNDVPQLVIARILQALGGCVALVGAMAMVQDFFPERERPKIFSLLILILGVSPLLAPTLGSFISVYFAWQWIFALLAFIAVLIGLSVYFFLPDAHSPQSGIKLELMPILRTYAAIMATPRFAICALGGALPFCGLFAYVAGSPLIFMGIYHVDARLYGIIFAFLSTGFIGGSQLNIFLIRKFSSLAIFITAIAAQCIIVLVFLICIIQGWLGLYGITGFLLSYLACIGISAPNSSTLALAPFPDNAGSASALLGVMQIGFGVITSGAVGILDSGNATPIIGIMAFSTWAGALVLALGWQTLAQMQNKRV